MDSKNIKSKNKNRFINMVILFVSIMIVVVLCMFLLDTTGKINQGNFRVSDIVVYSSADVQDTKIESTEAVTDPSQVNIYDLSDLKLDVSQRNEVSFLIAKSDGTEATSIYVDNVKISYPKLSEKIYIYQNKNNKTDVNTKGIRLDLVKEDKDDGQYLIKLNIDNENCVKGASIPDNAESLVFDGTIFNILNIKISDIKFSVEFNLNLVESNGRINTCKVKLSLPNELLFTNGICIINEDVSNFPFKIK